MNGENYRGKIICEKKGDGKLWARYLISEEKRKINSKNKNMHRFCMEIYTGNDVNTLNTSRKLNVQLELLKVVIH